MVKLFNYVVEAKFSARHKWSHFRIHKYPMHRHLVWGKLSVIYGQPHLEEIAICAQCGSEDIGEVADLTVCQDCQTIEGGYDYITQEEYDARN